MTNDAFHRLFGGPPRRPDADIEQRHMDLAASIQIVTEETVLAMARHVHGTTGQKNLVLAGGVALNAVANGRLSREGPFESVWIQPAAGDSGGALGAALFVWHQLLDKPRQPRGRDAQQGSLLGPHWSSAEVGRILNEEGVAHRHLQDERAMLEEVVDDLVAGKVVGWFRGRMEFGPRALGARSILGDPRAPAMQQTLNTRIKFRESFRPFAPAVLRDHASAWFGIGPEQESPYMLQVAPVLERHRVVPGAEDAAVMEADPDLRRRVNVVRSAVPAVTHVDFSARLQTVDAERNPPFHRLLGAFFARTGCPMLVNTSFNVRGEPIVCTPQDALRCFRATDMDTLVLEDRLIRKEAHSEAPPGATRSLSEHPPSRSGASLSAQAPTARALRQFAALWLLLFGGMAAWRMEVRHQPAAAMVLGLLAVLVGGAGLLRPAQVRPVFVGWMRVARPIGEVVSTVALGAVFAAIFVPAGVLQRALGRDALGLKRPRGESHWKPKKMASDVRSYLRQS
jgi:carbamoyltransferase